jgi:NADPH:quinone reductase
MTAWQALKVQRDGVLGEGMSVLVTGASDAVGRMGVQIAKQIVGSKGKVVAVGGVGSEVLKALGADVVVNYRETPDWAAEVRKEGLIDVVFDCVGGKVCNFSEHFISLFGHIREF